MADNNNLEFFLRQDYQELLESPVVVKSGGEDLRTWVYFDPFTQIPLENTMYTDDVTSGGGAINQDRSFRGSAYITYDHGGGRMRVDESLPTEQNSDIQETVTAFLEHALTDCLPAGYDSLMAVFSSHGAGFAGFGGDENLGLLPTRTRHHHHRKLIQTNQAIATAIKTALQNTPNAPEKLEVLGFDACLMQGVGAVDDYVDIADYILASESVQPGHGWAYRFLTNGTSALALSEEVVQTFVEESQGMFHQTPKLLSIASTTKFRTFIDAWEAFFDELLTLIKGKDRSLYASVSRSRSIAVVFEGVADSYGTNDPSSLDIGSWLESFDTLCRPDSESPLGKALQLAKSTYFDMFVITGVGLGTAPGTGMHITWPMKKIYRRNRLLWNQILFSNPIYATQMVPNFRAFLEWFLRSRSPPSGFGQESSTVCELIAVSDEEPTDDMLILADTAGFLQDNGVFVVEATISVHVDEVHVLYGMDLTSALGPSLIARGMETSGDDYLYLFGGDVAGTYFRDKFTAKWSHDFYFLNQTETGTFAALYVKDDGNGSRTIPVIYFPAEKKEEATNLQSQHFLFFDEEVWAEVGAQKGFLRFSVNETDGGVNANLLLYAYMDDNRTSSTISASVAQVPRSAGGLLMPLVEVNAYIQGQVIRMLPGGLNQTVIEWGEDFEYSILAVSAEDLFNFLGCQLDATVVEMCAFSNGAEQSDARYYDAVRPRRENTCFPLTTMNATNSTASQDQTSMPSTNETYVISVDGEEEESSNIFDHGGHTQDLIVDDSDQTRDNETTAAPNTTSYSSDEESNAVMVRSQLQWLSFLLFAWQFL